VNANEHAENGTKWDPARRGTVPRGSGVQKEKEKKRKEKKDVVLLKTTSTDKLLIYAKGC